MRDGTQLLAIVLVGLAVVLGAVTLYLVVDTRAKIEELSVRGELLGRDVAAIKAASQARPQRAAARQQQPSAPVVVPIGDDPVLGDPDAPVAIIEFSDYQCPFCRRFHKQVLPQLKKEFISTGKVKYVFKDNPLPFHELALPAAAAANCAGRQGKYWEMNDFLFESADNLKRPNILGYARKLGLDMKRFEQCLDDPAVRAEISRDMADAKRFGVRGTPGFFIGRVTPQGTVRSPYIRGVRPYQFFKSYIERQLAGK